ncbi:aldehyde dehydrogenase family protein [Klebsiella variicola]|uniref:aldehyde dehydrogenase family protein n=1 Tax=Klebsiella variicola TaxID=244366 RepID=UPI001C21D3A5|nr:aldehyde dehydrogenase family protein [Klebsiella variicola]
MREYSHFIDNNWREGATGKHVERSNPATDKTVSRFAQGGEHDIDVAVKAARNAFDNGPWPRMSAQERASVLYRLADLIEANAERLIDIEIAEVGKARRFVEGDIFGAAALTRHAASMAAQAHGEAYTNLPDGKTGLVLKQPVGVIGVIIPWNFPIEIFAKKVPFALATGCTVVVKPSEFTSGSVLEVAKLAIEAGLPAGVLNIVTGEGPEAGSALTTHPGVNGISFTGSTAVGQQIIRASADSVKRLSLELGGKSANIICSDADLDNALEGTLKSIFAFAGQCCVAGSRLMLQEDIADEFLRNLVARASALRVGDPASADTDLGSMISPQHTGRVMGFIERARQSGKTLLTGGETVNPGTGLSGNFVVPTIFSDVNAGDELFTDEVFGPVLSVTRFRTPDEAIELANRTRYGLANTIWTSKLETAMTASRRLESGIVWVNTTLDGAPQLPFGGIKASGYGRELGNAGFDDFTEHKTVILSSAASGAVFRGIS